MCPKVASKKVTNLIWANFGGFFTMYRCCFRWARPAYQRIFSCSLLLFPAFPSYRLHFPASATDIFPSSLVACLPVLHVMRLFVFCSCFLRFVFPSVFNFFSTCSRCSTMHSSPLPHPGFSYFIFAYFEQFSEWHFCWLMPSNVGSRVESPELHLSLVNRGWETLLLVLCVPRISLRINLLPSDLLRCSRRVAFNLWN